MRDGQSALRRNAVVRSAVITLALAIGACVPTSSLPAGCAAPTATLTVEIADGQMQPNDPAACLNQHLELTINSAQAGELHVHGYDDQGAEIELTPGEPAVLEFDAVRAGQFPVALHLTDGSEVEVAILTIHAP